MSNVPENLRYTAEHEWVLVTSPTTVRVGITDHAQDALGDIVFLTLPTVGTGVSAGQTCGEVESTKSVSDIYAPLSGTVTARNESVETAPETLNADPYGAGWLFDLELVDSAQLSELLEPSAYEALLGGQ